MVYISSSRIRSWLVRDKYNGNVDATALTSDLTRYRAGEPLDYIIGWKEFCGVRVDLSLRPLIPRDETEYWVRTLLPQISVRGAVRVLDLCAGSGAIGLAVLHACPYAQVDFADRESAALAQVYRNLAFHPKYEARARVILSDGFKNISECYDYILCNPPYIPRSRERKLPRSVSLFEPPAALFSGEDGLNLIRHILKETPKHLCVGGTLALEIDSTQKREVLRMASEYFHTSTLCVDQHGRPRVLLAHRGNN